MHSSKMRSDKIFYPYLRGEDLLVGTKKMNTILVWHIMLFDQLVCINEYWHRHWYKRALERVFSVTCEPSGTI